jgi:hypothetical protein
MFTERTLSPAVEQVRETHAPDTLVLDCAQGFETLPAAQAEELALVTDTLEPATYPEAWLPPDAKSIATAGREVERNSRSRNG